MTSFTDEMSSCVFLSQEDLGRWVLLNTKLKTLRLVPNPQPALPFLILFQNC